MKKREENLLAKIANLLQKDVEEVKELRALYSEEEAILEAQSVKNFYEWRCSLVKGPKETDAQFAARERVWQYKICEGCQGRFAYSYHYDGVKFCSLDCLSKDLKKIGISFTPGRPLNLRWGYRYPGIVPSTALSSVESALAASSSEKSEPSDSTLPNNHEFVDSQTGQDSSLLLQDTQV